MLSEEATRQWLEAHITESDVLKEIGRSIDSHGLPHLEMFVSQLALIRSLMGLLESRDVLELGTFMGYSTQAFVEMLGEFGGGSVTTVDSDADVSALARRAVRAPENVTVTYVVDSAESACTSFLKRRQTFDVILLDVIETAYLDLYDQCVDLVSDKGLLIIDNVLMETVAGWSNSSNAIEDTVDSTNRALADLHRLMFADNRVAASVIPLGSGIALCTRINRIDE